MAEGRSSARANLFVPRSGGALGSFLARHSLSSFEPADGRTEDEGGREGRHGEKRPPKNHYGLPPFQCSFCTCGAF